jgi:peptidoglycan/xylan/chitin deacetylase (PgdA/CDA1 family)
MLDPAIAILCYHSIDDSGSVLSTPPDLFAEQMRILSEMGVNVVPLANVRDVLEKSDISEPQVVITFDDGFMNLYEYGFPLLSRYGFPATVFLVTDFCGNWNDWPGQLQGIERSPLLGWREIREMNIAGVTFGSHTRTHPDLRKLTPERVEEEMVSSKKTIEDAIGHSVDSFAYPYGVYNETIRNSARRFFSIGCSTNLDFVRQGSDPLALERLDMYYLRHTSAFRHLFSRKTGRYIRIRRGLRNFRRQMAG